MNYLQAWFRFGKRVWLAQFAGYVSLLGVPLGIWRLDQAGALLVCSAIVAEILHEKRHRLFVSQIQPGVDRWYLYREVPVEGSSRSDIRITPHGTRSGSSTVNTTNWSMYHLARDDEFYDDPDGRLWDLERTMARAERCLDYTVVFTAIVGTVLWAFAGDWV